MWIQILQHVPLWVPFLFVVLLAIGLNQTKTREVAASRLLVRTLCMQVFAMWGLFSVFHSLLAILGWLTGLVGCAVLAYRWRVRQGLSIDLQTRRLRIPGSYWPLVMIVLIFAVKFTVATSLGFRPDLAGNAVFIGVIGLMYGAFGGFFLSPVRMALSA